ncbi:stage II sporulation protein E [Anaerosalibacter sp. Marseille-P3206]|uniref:stage II sporulation protein E n=1 Tax=Anaerosalibacter sp. Marseille-P3206 TaxID=1871005 RepID=UPI0013562AD8|nr:stage II sporulation protein E [Anaerosalibacter sp. Marseille-P3206]
MLDSRTAVISLKEKKTVQKMVFKRYYILIGILGFFISRAGIIKGLTPFGISFLSASIGTSFSFISLISVLLGIISFHGLSGYNYLFTAGIIYVLNTQLSKNKKMTKLKTSILSSIVFLGVSLVDLFVFKDVFIYDIVMITFEGLVVFTLSYIFSYSIPKIEQNYKLKYTSEEIICVFITLSLAIAGLGDIGFSSISFKNIISIFTVLTFGYYFGAPLGAGIGVIVGMISYIAQVDMPFILAIFGFSGLLSGVFKDLGKIGSILGFILGNCILSFYINGFSTSFLNYKELSIGLLLFFVLSRYFLENVFNDSLKSLAVDKNDTYSSDRISDLTTRKLMDVSEIFNELGNIFIKAVENEDVCTDNVTHLIDQVAKETCNKCSMRKFCWKEDLYTTYYSFFNLLASLEMTGEIHEDSLPELFTNTCIKTEEVIEKTNSVFERYRINYMWERKLTENRKLVSEQLMGISKIMEEIMNDINKEITFNSEVEESVYSQLRVAGVDAAGVTVAEFDDDFEIYIEVNKHFKNENSLENVREIVSEVIGIPLSGQFIVNNIRPKEVTRYKLVKANRFSAITKIAKSNESDNNVSGDSFTFGEENNKYFAALSDGMGVGKKASFESTIAISLLEKFLEAGFDIELGLKTINSILMLKSGDEIFTTLDIGNIDLYTGKLEAIKTGAAPTFIKKQDKVEVISSHSLPVGMLKDLDIEIYEEDLDDGDFVIMISDGVLESNEEVCNKEKWIIDIIEKIDSLNPQTIANMILKEAKKVSKDGIKDDMTVLVTKVWKAKK